LKGRIAIPLNDAAGRLIGYAGQLVDEADVSEERPRILFPSKRERNGVTLDFRKSRVLYNGNRIEKPVEAIIVVKDFFSVWWLYQNGFKNVVAVMDSDCLDEQAKLLVEAVQPSGRIWILTADQQFAAALLPRLAQGRFSRWAKLEESQQPADLSGSELEDCFAI